MTYCLGRKTCRSSVGDDMTPSPGHEHWPNGSRAGVGGRDGSRVELKMNTVKLKIVRLKGHRTLIYLQ